MSEQIRHSIAIPKAAIMVAGGMEGMINDAPVQIGNVRHGTGTLRFLCFSGALDISSGLYCGHLCFEAHTDAGTITPDGVAEFDRLLALNTSVDESTLTEEIHDEL